VADRKARRQSAADQRAQLQPLKKAVQKLERCIEESEQSLLALQDRLADEQLYAQPGSAELAQLLKQEGAIKHELAALESQWIAEQEKLESMEAGAPKVSDK
jgi:ATP-binding cassette subfamily F protein 3